MVQFQGRDKTGIMVRPRHKKQYRRTFIKEWREFRGLSQERLAERIGKTAGLISQVENRKGPYTQETLEAIADALLCEPVDLLIRNPQDPDGIWSVWEGLKPAEKQQAIKVLRALKEAS